LRDNRGVALPYDERGSGAPVVLLHAGVADRRMWSEHLDPLACAGLRAVAPDLPGFGDAPARERGAPWEEVLGTMEALGIERAALVGNSFGGDVALRVAALAPERVRAIVLVSSSAPGVEPSAELQALWEREERALERGDVDGAVAAVVAAWTQPSAPEALRERIAEMQRRSVELQADAGEPLIEEDPLERDPQAITRVNAPTLVAVGEHDKAYFQECAEVLAGALPACRRATIAGAGHLAPLEQPEKFRALLLDFLGSFG
jgi:3-oxoadipate enol-lactonase